MAKNSQETANVEKVKHHTSYYFEYIVFRVEDVLSRVPKSGFLAPGSTFADMFSLPVADGEMIEGCSDDKPIYLEGVTESYFHGFLLVMYPFNGAATTYEEWLGALDLATMWRFQSIRQKAIVHLSALNTQKDVIEIILLAKKYRIKAWLRESYLAIVQQKELKIDDMLSPRTLDWETISRIFAVQSLIKYWQPPPPPRTYCENCASGWGTCLYNCQNFQSDQSVQNTNTNQIDLATISTHVDRIFQQEFAEADIENETDIAVPVN